MPYPEAHFDWASDLIDEVCCQLQNAGFNDDEHGDLAAITEEVLHTGVKGNRSLFWNPNQVARVVAMELGRVCAERTNKAAKLADSLISKQGRDSDPV